MRGGAGNALVRINILTLGSTINPAALVPRWQSETVRQHS